MKDLSCILRMLRLLGEGIIRVVYLCVFGSVFTEHGWS